MEGGSPILEWITYGIVGFILLALLLLALRSAYFFLSLVAIPVLGALGRTRLFGGAVRRWGERGAGGGLPTLGATDEIAVDEAAARVSGVRVPRAVSLGLRIGAALGAAPGVWLALRGGWLGRARGAPPTEIAADVLFGLCLIASAGALVGGALGALAGAGVDAVARGRRNASGAPGD
jgi:hypothetical protein